MEPIARFIEKLNTDKQLILDDLDHHYKQKHWMWWGFPQQVSPQFLNKVSQTTRTFSITYEEAVRFLCHPALVNYYEKALDKFIMKDDLLYYFGQVD